MKHPPRRRVHPPRPASPAPPPLLLMRRRALALHGAHGTVHLRVPHRLLQPLDHLPGVLGGAAVGERGHLPGASRRAPPLEPRVNDLAEPPASGGVPPHPVQELLLVPGPVALDGAPRCEDLVQHQRRISRRRSWWSGAPAVWT
ncbi:hypothetical protein PAHAL_7G238200 [Panicum hallii]|uniref:Uncharacterized protein n=1 Tax=Panicum hallii TaxID=206008 RepID=A0A2S3I8V1_9POAL|nr:hypothetical protein PAHAL_7G238200 [Panicum hallii]